ncbi:MAG: hypothetical protein ACOCY0_00610 [Roseicyclus sp.]
MTAPGHEIRVAGAPVMTCLGPDDLGDLLAFHAALHDAATVPGLFVRETEDFFLAHLGASGRVLGLRDAEGRLRAYGVLGLPAAADPENFAQGLGLDAADRARVCHLDGCGVDPAWRGRGLQRDLARARLRLGRVLGRDLAISAAAPANLASLANLIRAGLEVRALVEKYDALRFLLVHDARACAVAGPPSARVALPGTRAAHVALLDSGLRGIAVEGATTCPVLVYAAGEGGPQ